MFRSILVSSRRSCPYHFDKEVLYCVITPDLFIHSWRTFHRSLYIICLLVNSISCLYRSLSSITSRTLLNRAFPKCRQFCSYHIKMPSHFRGASFLHDSIKFNHFKKSLLFFLYLCCICLWYIDISFCHYPAAQVLEEPGILGYCFAMYDYSAMEPNQISLKHGDRIAIVNKAGANRGWWKGRLDGKVSLTINV